MADSILGFKPAQEISPNNPLNESCLQSIKEDNSLVSVSSIRSSTKNKSNEVETGIPPSKNYKIAAESSISSLQLTRYSLNQSNTYKHKRDQTATMPYNNTAIPPPEEITGAASLPC